jgi:hypothetical protein
MFEEQELSGNSPYASFSPNEDLNVGESFCIYFKETAEATSPEYGEFTVLNGVKFNCSAATEQELIDSMELASFVPNTLLLNKIASNSMRAGDAYRIEKKWNRGDKYDGNKKAKGYGYSVYKLSASNELLNKFEAFISENLGTSVAAMGETPVEEEAPKPKI